MEPAYLKMNPLREQRKRRERGASKESEEFYLVVGEGRLWSLSFPSACWFSLFVFCFVYFGYCFLCMIVCWFGVFGHDVQASLKKGVRLLTPIIWNRTITSGDQCSWRVLSRPFFQCSGLSRLEIQSSLDGLNLFGGF